MLTNNHIVGFEVVEHSDNTMLHPTGRWKHSAQWRVAGGLAVAAATGLTKLHTNRYTIKENRHNEKLGKYEGSESQTPVASAAEGLRSKERPREWSRMNTLNGVHAMRK